MNRLHLIQVIIGVLFLSGGVVWAQEEVIASDETSATDTAISAQPTPDTLVVQSGIVSDQRPKSSGDSKSRSRRRTYAVSEEPTAEITMLESYKDWGGFGADSVLVIPTGDISVEAMKIIQEDMTIMGRILYKRIRSDGDYGMVSDYYMALNLDTLRGWPGGRTVEGMYLQDYGILYFLQVKIPLLPPSKTQEKKEEEDVTDPLWAQTKQELQNKQNAGYYAWLNTTRIRSAHKPRYLAERVAELKQNLLKALRHASNIRSLKADEWITVVVVGEGIQNLRPQLLIQNKHDDNREELIYVDPFRGQSGSTGQTVLTVRIKKADVDAVAKKDITQEEFEKRVQMFSYAAAGTTRPPAPSLSVPAPIVP